MDNDSRKVTEEAWLICPNWNEVRRFTKNKNNKDKFFDYMFIDSGVIVGSNGESPPLMKTRKEIKIDDARKALYGFGAALGLKAITIFCLFLRSLSGTIK